MASTVCLITISRCLLPAEYDNLLPSDLDGLVCVDKGGKWGVLDSRTRKMILPLEFDWKPQSKGYYFEVIKDHKYGLYHMAGKMVITPNEATPLNFDNIYKGFLVITDYRAQTVSYADHYGHLVLIKGPANPAH